MTCDPATPEYVHGTTQAVRTEMHAMGCRPLGAFIREEGNFGAALFDAVRGLAVMSSVPILGNLAVPVLGAFGATPTRTDTSCLCPASIAPDTTKIFRPATQPVTQYYASLPHVSSPSTGREAGGMRQSP